MTFGLSQRSLQTLYFIVNRFQKLYPNLNFYVFGSRAKGTHRELSDLDLLVEGNPNMDDATFGLLKESFEESDLPIKVDLVRVQDLFQPYRDEINATKLKL